MNETVTVLLEAGFAVIAASLLAAVGAVILRRQTDPTARRANALFAMWWIALGLLYLEVALLNFVAPFATPSLATLLVATLVAIALIVAAIWGLCYYLLYLYTGRAGLFWLVTAAYALLGVLFLASISWRDPVSVDASALPARIMYARELPPAVGFALGLLVTVPVILSAIAYGSLYFKVREPLQRFRVGVVSLAFIAWFGWSLAGSVVGVFTDVNLTLAWKLASRAIGLLAPLVILGAFAPPAWLRNRVEAAARRGTAAETIH